MSSSEYYPLAVGNTWTYEVKGGQSYTSTVTSQDGDTFTTHTTLVNATSHIKHAGGVYLSDSPEAGKTIIIFKDSLKVGDSWQNSYKVNGIDTNLTYVVKEVDATKSVKGQTFGDVMIIEGDAKMSMNGTPVPMKYVTTYYYAKGVGLVLTTSSSGDEHALVSYTVK